MPRAGPSPHGASAAATFRLRLAPLPLYVACLVLLFLSSDSTAYLSVLAAGQTTKAGWAT